MLKRIKRHQVRVGMYVTDIEDPLGDKAKPVRNFFITDETDVSKVRSSGIISLVIDIDKGCDIDAGAPSTTHRSHAGTQSASSFSQAEIRQAMQAIEQTRPLLDTLFSDVRLSGTAAYEHADLAVDQIGRSMKENPAALIGITRLKSKDEYTFLHSVAVSALMIHFARFLHYDEATIHALGISGLLHDIGKMLMPSTLLSKKGTLTEDEMKQIRTHPVRGYELLARQGMPDMVLDVCLHHHERIDGKGYPFGLSGEKLSMAVRMAAICDVYDAMTSVRSYKAAWTPGQALAMMQKSEGCFDRHLLRQFNTSLRTCLSPQFGKSSENQARAS